MNMTVKAIDKLIEYFEIKTISDLAVKLDIAQSTISGWKSRNAIGALVDVIASKDLKALEYIFKNENIDYSRNNASQNIMKSEPNIDENILKLVDTLCSFAKTNNKFDELKKDLSSLLPKYM